MTVSFISVNYVLFLSILIPIFFLLRERFGSSILLIGSCAFYLYAGIFPLSMLLLSILLDYLIAKKLYETDRLSTRRAFLSLSLVLNLGILLFFKHASSFDLPRLGVSSTGFPIGISFYTFTKLGYVIDVYKKRITPERHIGYFATFITFFPSLTSGPIERANHLLPQLKKVSTFDEERVVQGFRRILWGLFKKIVIADRLAFYVDHVYNDPKSFSGPVLLVVTFFLAFQIYADFSAYTDIALGTAKIFGIELFENFKQPYFATSILDFWRRWHISLTSWIREYIFLPLSRALLRKSDQLISPRYVQGISYLITMILVGFWHGASWAFIAWGTMHGLYMVIEMLLPSQFRLPPKTKLQTFVRAGITFFLVSFAWIFFRVESLSDAIHVITRWIPNSGNPLSGIGAAIPSDPGINTLFKIAGFTDISEKFLAITNLSSYLLSILVLLLVDLADAKYGFLKSVETSPRLIRWGFYYGITATILLLGAWGTQEFIYFQF